MKTSKNGLAFIEKEEGVILHAYDDYNDKVVKEGDEVKGTLTIGTGHTSAAGAPKVFVGQTITKAQADAILASDLRKVEAQVNSLVKVPINQNQFDALVSFQFNTGGLGRSSLLRSLNNKDYKQAAENFIQWSKANGNPTLLAGRRTREKNLFLTPGPKSSGAGGLVVAVGTGAAAATAVHANHHYMAIAIVAVVVVALIGFAIYEYKKVKSNA